MRRTEFSRHVLCLVLLGLFWGGAPFARCEEKPTTPILEPVKDMRLQNAFKFTPEIISGAQPEDDAAFQALAEMKVKTIISVDGAMPDVALAQKYGMRYVHLPFGYDGIPADRALEIAKAIEELPGPVFVHCHHGKHRSPAAAAAACVILGKMNAADTTAALKQAGTGAEYIGLYASASNSTRADKAALEKVKSDFPAVSKLPPLAECMVEVDNTWERINLIEKAGWKTPLNNRDLIPAHEVLQLREKFHELGRTEEIQKRPEAFKTMLRDSEHAAELLENALRENRTDDVKIEFVRVGQSCLACHKDYRNVPRSRQTK